MGLGAVVPVLSRAIKTIERSALRRLYRDEFPSSLMTIGFTPKKSGGRSVKEICHEQCTADAEGDCRVAG